MGLDSIVILILYLLRCHLIAIAIAIWYFLVLVLIIMRVSLCVCVCVCVCVFVCPFFLDYRLSVHPSTKGLSRLFASIIILSKRKIFPRLFENARRQECHIIVSYFVRFGVKRIFLRMPLYILKV